MSVQDALAFPGITPGRLGGFLQKGRHRIPNKTMLHHLSGAVRFDTEFVESWKRSQTTMESIKNYLRQTLAQPINNRLKKLIGIE